jgi:hypothetical protein
MNRAVLLFALALAAPAAAENLETNPDAGNNDLLLLPYTEEALPHVAQRVERVQERSATAPGVHGLIMRNPHLPQPPGRAVTVRPRARRAR